MPPKSEIGIHSKREIGISHISSCRYNKWFVWRRAMAISHYVSISAKDDFTLIDAGCGLGDVLRLLPLDRINHVVEVDIEPEYLKNIKRLLPFGHVDFVAADIDKLPFKIGNISVLTLCSEVLDHLQDPENALNELCRISSQTILTMPLESKLLYTFKILIPGKPKKFSDHMQHSYKIMGYNWELHELISSLTRQGFRIKYYHTLFFTLPLFVCDLLPSTFVGFAMKLDQKISKKLSLILTSSSLMQQSHCRRRIRKVKEKYSLNCYVTSFGR